MRYNIVEFIQDGIGRDAKVLLKCVLGRRLLSRRCIIHGVSGVRRSDPSFRVGTFGGSILFT